MKTLNNLLDSLEKELTANGFSKKAARIIKQSKKKAQEQETLILIDDLTGIYNRKALKKIALSLRSRLSHNPDIPISMAFLDLDEFKQVNDMHGHDAGDEALKHFANQVQECIRGSDFFIRWGGDEFVLIMPDTTVEESELMMKRMHQKLKVSTFKHEGEDLHIVASIGIAGLKDDESFEELLKRSDAQGYRAKRKPSGVSADD